MKAWHFAVPCAVIAACVVVIAQPAQNALSIPVKVDANGYLLASANAYSGQAGPARNLANTMLKVDSNGYLMTTLAGGPALFADGTSAAPSIAFASQPGTGFWLVGASNPTLSINGATKYLWNATEHRVGTSVVLGWSSNTDPSAAVSDLQVAKSAAGVFRVAGVSGTLGTLFPCGVAPTISSGFNQTTPTITSGSGCGFLMDVGSGTLASSGVIALNATAPGGWHCTVVNLTNVASTLTSQSASSTTTATFQNYVRTTGVAGNFASGDDLSISCVGR
jgi:hypothetical protein